MCYRPNSTLFEVKQFDICVRYNLIDVVRKIEKTSHFVDNKIKCEVSARVHVELKSELLAAVDTNRQLYRAFISGFKCQLFIPLCVSADPDDECELPEGEAGIVWDAICFTVLLAQRRVFLSYYFLYVVSDLKSSKILASRSVLQLPPG